MVKKRFLESSQVSSTQQSKKTRRYRRRAGRSITPYRNFPFPKSWIGPVRYVECFSMNAPIGVPTQYAFSANGLYDPNITGTGHQPMGFDQMMALYNHYEVIGAKITLTAINSGTVEGFNMGIKLDDNSTLAANDLNNSFEHPMTSWRSISSTYDTPNSITQTFSQKSFFGDKSGDRETWGDAAANPIDQAYFICIVGPVTSTQDLATLPMVAQIDYLVKWHEPKDFVAS